MLIVVSNHLVIPNEARLINALFAEGLEVFHLRKPGATVDEVSRLLEEISPSNQSKISLHQHHSIANDFKIARLHFTEMKRQETDEGNLIQLKKSNFILSTSIHQTEEYKNLSSCFSYTFFGPVFNSISKEGYASTLTEEFKFPVKENRPKVIALGGIDATNMQTAMKMKFDGVAVLGAIWQKPEESIQKFKAIQQAWKQVDQ